MTRHIKPSLCPQCGATFSAISALNEEETPVPKAGDMCACIECATLVAFDTDGSVHRATEAEKQTIQRDDPEGWAVLLWAIAAIPVYNRHYRTAPRPAKNPFTN